MMNGIHIVFKRIFAAFLSVVLMLCAVPCNVTCGADGDASFEEPAFFEEGGIDDITPNPGDDDNDIGGPYDETGDPDDETGDPDDEIGDPVEDDEELLFFEEPYISYTFGDREKGEGVISDQKALKKYPDDDGTVTYSANVKGKEISLEDIGISVDSESGIVSLSGPGKLFYALDGEEELIVEIVAYKEDGAECDEGYLYHADEASYEIGISFADITDDPYVLTVPDENGELTVVSEPNGMNGWFDTEVTVVPSDPDVYEIAKVPSVGTDELPVFAGEAVFDDQGEAERRICLRDKMSGVITRPLIVSEVERIDTVAPDSSLLSIEYSVPFSERMLSLVSFGFYSPSADVKVAGYDDGSGIDVFDVRYERNGDNEGFKEKEDWTLNASRDEDDPARYFATFTVEADAADQYRGSFYVSATDAAGNRSEEKDDRGNVIVVDTVSSVLKVTHGLLSEDGEARVYGGRYYYSDDAAVTFEITESDFFEEDVTVSVSKDGVENVIEELEWERLPGSDTYATTVVLDEEGDYVVTLMYNGESSADPSGNKMIDENGNETGVYSSPVITIDKTDPVSEIRFERDGLRQEAVITVKERNFIPSGIDAEIVCSDINGRLLKGSGDFTSVVEYLREGSSWIRNGDIYTARMGDGLADGIYDLPFAYTDPSGRKGAGTSCRFTIDRSAPLKDSLSVSYSEPVGKKEHSSFMSLFYRPFVTVTFAAKDNVTGVDHFTCDLIGSDGAVVTKGITIPAVRDENDPTLYRATLILPKDKADRMKVSLAFSATDGYGNTSVKKRDDGHLLVADTIAPVITVGYTEPVRTVGNKRYYDGKCTVTFTITETNFFKEDVIAGISVNGGSFQRINIDWEEVSPDVHKGSYFVGSDTYPGEDGDHVIKIAYTDRSGNVMPDLLTDIIVNDTTGPDVSVTYTCDDPGVKADDGMIYYKDTVTALVRVHERNFDPERLSYILNAKDAYGRSIDADLLVKKLSGADNGDDHYLKVVFMGDACYSFAVTCRDLAGNFALSGKDDAFTVDTYVSAPIIKINGREGNGMAFKDDVVPEVSFADDNLGSFEIRLTRTRLDRIDEDVTDEFIGDRPEVTERAWKGIFDTFPRKRDSDGIYTLFAGMTDKAGNSAESTVSFTVNRFGSVYTYDNYLVSLVSDGGAYVKELAGDLVITEYNADRLIEGSLRVDISRDGKLLDDVIYSVSPEISPDNTVGERGWYQYRYEIGKGNFDRDGVYKIAVSSKDTAGNAPDTSSDGDNEMIFRVDSTAPEITGITGLEEEMIDRDRAVVTYDVFDAVALSSVTVLVDGEKKDEITDLSDNENNFEGSFILEEKNEAQHVRIVVTDKAGNVTDTAAAGFAEKCAFDLKDTVLVSTNLLVRTKAFIGANAPSVIGGGSTFAGASAMIALLLRKKKRSKRSKHVA